jgi:quinol monooxygenase YgiN
MNGCFDGRIERASQVHQKQQHPLEPMLSRSQKTCDETRAMSSVTGIILRSIIGQAFESGEVAVMHRTFTPRQHQMSINVIITFEAAPEKLDAFRHIMQDVKRELPNAPGCKGVRVYNRRDNPHVFTLVEQWESQTVHQAFLDKATSSGTWAHIATHLAQDPVSHYYAEL